MNCDLDVLYAELEDNDNEDYPIPQADGLAGLYDSDDDEDEDYNTESDSENESDDEDTDTASGDEPNNNYYYILDDYDESTGIEIPGVEIPGVDNNIKNFNQHPIEIPGVEIPGVDNNLQDENNHPVVDNDEKRRYIVPNDRRGGGLNMNLRNVSRINYKFIHYGKEIPINDEEEMIFLDINDKDDIEEAIIDEYEA